MRIIYQIALSLLFMLVMNNNVFAQWNKDSLRNSIWYLGFQWSSPYVQKINFLNVPFLDNVNQTMEGMHNFASICDTNGRLIFYTNGGYIYDSTHSLMLNGDSINPEFGGKFNFPDGARFLDDGCIILPQPKHDSLYFIFHVSNDGIQNNFAGFFQWGKFFYYSIVNMKRNNGKGEVVSKNNVLISQNLDSLSRGHVSACRHANGNDWWVLIKDIAGNTFYRYLLDSAGVHSFPAQNIGVPTVFGNFCKAEFSPDGKYFATFTGQDWTWPTDTPIKISIYEFDRCSGLLENPYQFDAFFTYPDGYYLNQGMSFSPNSKYLYFNNIDTIFQYNILNQSYTVVGVVDTSTIPTAWKAYYTLFKFQNMKLAQNNRIYISSAFNTLSYIDEPDLPGNGCDFHQNEIILSGTSNALYINYPYFNTAPIICDTVIGPDITNNVLYQERRFSVYPNPANTLIYIKYNNNIASGLNNLEDEYKEIYSLFGKLLIRTKSNVIDVSDLNSGVYYVKIKSFTQKIVIQ